MPEPGIPKLQYLLPSGLTPKRKPRKPKLVPIPLFETEALNGPKFLDFLNLQAIILFQNLLFHLFLCLLALGEFLLLQQ